MKWFRTFSLSLGGLLTAAFPALSQAAEAATAVAASGVPRMGVSALWVLANVSYAGMRAQGSKSWVWRIVSFLVGFPGTGVSWLFVKEGGGRAYGIALPRANERDERDERA